MTKVNNKKGFTLIELSLATLFLAVLLLMIATITINVSTIYQKGLSLRNVNATGRMIIDDLQRSISSAPLLKMSAQEQQDKVFRERISENTVRVKRTDQTENVGNVQLSGAFCSGKYSYVWNTGYVLNGYDGVVESPVTLRSQTTGETMTPYLAKFADPSRSACEVDFKRTNTIEISAAPEEMLSQTDGQIRLALYEMTIFPVVQDQMSWRSFYSGAFVLATLTGEVNIKSSGDYCDPANSQSFAGDFNYCAVNNFNFAAQTSGQ